MVTVAILGLGGRGYYTYAKYQKLFPERMKIVAVAEPITERLEMVKREFSVPSERCFSSAEDLLKRERLADALFVCTQDRQHKEHAIAGMERGYEILLEKPVATTPEDVMSILRAAIRYNRLVTVCHVLRYTKFFGLIKDLLEKETIGRVTAVCAEENVGFWHQTHSFVRGNWKNEATTSPMILQKCCHDFDLFNWLLGKRCISLSSIGSLTWFKKENAPEGSGERCSDCKLQRECPYSAYKIYFDNSFIGYNCGRRTWPLNIVCEPVTEANLNEALEKGPYGKCVYRCDNDVVDHQSVQLLYEDDVTISFMMSGFTAENKRLMKIMGTNGEIVADHGKNLIAVTRFGETAVEYDVAKMAADLSGHGGGDNEMLTRFFETLENRGEDVTSVIQNSVQSHMVAFAAEYSRLHGGEKVNMDEFIRPFLNKNE